ncbi:MAG: SMC-Scp complex subunit ScpB [Deltaproteobacteria bacterium RIFCSPLOWO2_01_44_7]|nr:MAG: SMC-Scp complex subunit ScpB [Deltaproteobacteria bacterium RIFCSPHIGHO2_01_FULL_43_49]OGQ16407.1 MAG: SMC-Scp complex subunit ScpB [Deltaproteobacteria bacterium RIFCSPHIGHO2_02_FULL_44_53]OGQ27766.1 MAG: SMC-Scp complex subunit ScpB [Deltaproteobacteria bacterium RIFCSPHIGHO2_12_FULL_44_21]OGQ32925.1 MAG: SMC-Scp complex subunit ScpB [Deltaproteobacteria bacterium RIFCSPLOWO2_01_FULL_45_74]OGQ38702.1 MAG: SMC-Scp complex subunit ScpB [Deltaproteobacteria bacterium RIFCSPLOWO2_01_44_7]
MEIKELKPILESLIFASEDPLSASGLTLILQEAGVDKDQVELALKELAQEYNENEWRGLLLREVGGGYQFVTKPTFANWLQKLNVSKPKSLTQASLETLAIVAYRQPLVRSELEAIRGVDSGAVLKTLLERGFIKILGRREEAGQPLIYGTTQAFLELFHLNNLEELPSMKEIEQLVDNQQTETKSDEVETTTEEDWVDGGIQDVSSLSFVEGGTGDDTQALADLEDSIKELRQLEKEIFPKEEASEGQPQTPVADETKEPEL